MHFKGAQCKLIIGGHENHHGHRLRSDGVQHAEAVQLRHLHVQKDKFGRRLFDSSNRPGAISALADDLYCGLVAKQLAQPVARQRLVVDNQRANFHATRPVTPSISAAERTQTGGNSNAMAPTRGIWPRGMAASKKAKTLVCSRRFCASLPWTLSTALCVSTCPDLITAARPPSEKEWSTAPANRRPAHRITQYGGPRHKVFANARGYWRVPRLPRRVGACRGRFRCPTLPTSTRHPRDAPLTRCGRVWRAA